VTARRASGLYGRRPVRSRLPADRRSPEQLATVDLEPPMSSIFINITQSDALEKSPIDKAITRVAVALARQRLQGALPAGPSLEITFLLASADLRPDFEGMRMGGYTAGDPVLRFHVAVPAHLAQSPLAPRYVAAVLGDVLGNAQDYFAERQIPFDGPAWRRVFQAAAVQGEDLSDLTEAALPVY
jgi:hypothetical protein